MGTRKISDRRSILCGESFQQVFTELEPPFNFKLIGAGEREIKLTPQFKGADILLKIENIEQPGNYRILHNDQTLTIFSVNSWPQESQMDFYSEEELGNIFANGFVINDYTQANEIVLQSRFGKELWKQFLFIAILLLIVEMIIARTGTKKEFASAKVPEPALKS